VYSPYSAQAKNIRINYTQNSNPSNIISVGQEVAQDINLDFGVGGDFLFTTNPQASPNNSKNSY
jgi:hypothetical protein